MEKKALIKAMSVAASALVLVACGSDSDSSSNSGSKSFSSNLSANPNFQFDQTNYVGAFENGTADWASFALQGSLPSAAAKVVAAETAPLNLAQDFDPQLTADAIVQDVSDITPVTHTKDGEDDVNNCPISSVSGLQVSDTETTYTRDGKDFIVCELTGTIDSDVTLANTVVWQLNSMVKVGNGSKKLTSADNVVTNATLTIEKGAMLRSKAGSSLVITRGSKIMAEGTATQPIIMWSNNDDDLNDRGEWGGLVLQGYAYNNGCDDAPGTAAYCNIAGEGATGNFGGYDNADSSGSLKYVIVAEAGNEISAGNELNGISFQGVGYGTTVDYIQVHQNDDDGVEFFGGAVDVKHFVLTANKDDDVDWDEGYVGNLQYGVIVKTTSKDNSRHAFELDTAGDNAESAYQESNPTVANVTAMSLLSDAEMSAAGDGIHLKKGSEGRFFNVALLGDFTNCVYMKDETNYTTADNANASFKGVAGTACTKNTNTLPTGYTLPDTDFEGVTIDTSLVVQGATATSATIESEEVIN